MKAGKKRQTTAWLLALVMVCSMVMIPGGVVNAAVAENAILRIHGNPTSEQNGKIAWLDENDREIGSVEVYYRTSDNNDVLLTGYDKEANAADNQYLYTLTTDITQIEIRLYPAGSYEAALQLFADYAEGATNTNIDGRTVETARENAGTDQEYLSYCVHTEDLADIERLVFQPRFDAQNDGGGNPGGGDVNADKYADYSGEATATLTVSGLDSVQDSNAMFYLNGKQVLSNCENEEITYVYDNTVETGKETVEFQFDVLFNCRYTAVTINGISYASSIPGYDSDGNEKTNTDKIKKNVLDAIALNGNNQTTSFLVSDVPKADTYDVQVSVKGIEDGEAAFWPVGNFLWTALQAAENDHQVKNNLFTLYGEGELDAGTTEDNCGKYNELDLTGLNEQTIYLKIRPGENMTGTPAVTIHKDNASDTSLTLGGDQTEYTASFTYSADVTNVTVHFGEGTLDLQENDGDVGEPDCIKGGRIEFVEAVYDGKTYTGIDALQDLPCYYDWNEFFERGEDGKELLDENGNKIPEGGAVFPAGTSLTVKLVPDSGKQLVTFGVNGGKFDVGTNPSTYTFVVPNGNFHLNARFESVDDVVSTESEKVKAGSITLADGSITEGSAQLTVSDATLSSDKIQDFEEAADGYIVSNYLDIDLANIFFKGDAQKVNGVWTSDDVWSDPIEELDKKATISIQLAESVNAEGIVIVHNVHDGDIYETLRVDSYDEATDTITFQTDSFSNFAIATKKTAEQLAAEEKAAADKKAADTVTVILNTLPSASAVSLVHEARITSAENSYNALTADQKALVSEAAVKKLADVKAALAAAKTEASDKTSAGAVITMLNALPAASAVTTADETKIAEARKAYDALTANQKALVSAGLLKKLTDAETALATAKAAGQVTEVGGTVTDTSSGSGTSTSTYTVSKKSTGEGNTGKATYTGEADGCTATAITIPDTITGNDGVTYEVTKIADNALKGNTTVKTVTVGNNIKEIGVSAFQNAKKLTTVKLGTGVTSIGKNAFSGCTSLKKVTSSGSKVTTVAEAAFKGDKALTSIDLSKSKVKTIGKNAFSGDKKLKTIKINGNNLTKVGKNAFKDVKKNATITVGTKNKTTYNKVVKLILKSGAKNVKYKYKKKK